MVDTSIQLKEGEEIGWQDSPSIKYVYGSLISSAIAFFVFASLSFVFLLAINSLLLVGIIFFSIFSLGTMLFTGYAYIIYNNTTYYVTNKRVIRKYEGRARTKYADVSVSKIQNTGWNQTIAQKIFELGEVQISTAGSSGEDIEFTGIENPEKVRDLVMEAVDRFSGQSDSLSEQSTVEGGDLDEKIYKELVRLNNNMEELKESKEGGD